MFLDFICFSFEIIRGIQFNFHLVFYSTNIDLTTKNNIV